MFITAVSLAQPTACPNIDAGPDQSIDCSVTCTDLHATVLETGQTTSYAVSSIPFASPYPTTGGNTIFVGQDDVWSNSMALPFNFCFYGSQKNQVVIGANGLITFDPSVAGDYCEWSYNASVPSSQLQGNSIMGAYHDIDPSVNSGTDISWAVLGSAPCRTFVVNYHNVAHFSCNSEITTQQIILYETTNIIEVYVHDKPTCFTWNDGNAVIGIQNVNGSQGVTAPGRNTGNWSASNEAWRFTPSGPPNWDVNWFDQSGTFVGNGLDVPNVCMNSTTTFAAEVVYTNCDGSTMKIVDSVTVDKVTSYTVTAAPINETCFNNCDGEISVATSGPGVAPYTYDIGSGPQASSTFTGLCAGNYTIIVTDALGCISSVSSTVGGPTPLIITTTDTTVCSSGTATLSPVVSGGLAPYSYLWDTGETTSSITVSPTSSQAYCVTITDANGCASVNTCMDVDLRGLITADAGPDQTLCLGTTVQLSASAFGGTGNYTYSWNQGLGLGQTKLVSPSADTTYMVIIHDDCETPPDTAYVFVDVITPAAIAFEADYTTGCAPLTVKFTSTGVPPGATCTWTFGDGSTSNDFQTTSHVYTQGGCHTVKLTITTTDGCIISYELEDYICPEDSPIAEFTWNPELPSIFDSRVWLINQTSGAVSYEWIITVDGDETRFYTENAAFEFPSVEPGTYQVCLIATNASGCTNMICQDIKVVDDVHVFIPNAFTPDGDGRNDIFTPVLSQPEISNYEFIIFDRWGKQLFSSTRMGEGWDGTNNGDQLPIGVYVWMIRLKKDWNNEYKDLKGHVTIVR